MTDAPVEKLHRFVYRQTAGDTRSAEVLLDGKPLRGVQALLLRVDARTMVPFLFLKIVPGVIEIDSSAAAAAAVEENPFTPPDVVRVEDLPPEKQAEIRKLTEAFEASPWADPECRTEHPSGVSVVLPDRTPGGRLVVTYNDAVTETVEVEPGRQLCVFTTLPGVAVSAEYTDADNRVFTGCAAVSGPTVIELKPQEAT